ncbi:MAG: hypothetical protein LBM99_06000 [Bacillales bacterium]|jgi:hypothetical protein|nr:hypothetical protein [Bacillales bacterium]
MYRELFNKNEIINYEDVNLGKVIYSEECLKSMESLNRAIVVTDEHTGAILDEITKVVYDGEKLIADVPESLYMKGYGLSTEIDLQTLPIDDNTSVAIGGDILKIARTTKPRNMLVFNSQAGTPTTGTAGKSQSEVLLAEIQNKNDELEKQKQEVENLRKEMAKNKEIIEFAKENEEFIKNRETIIEENKKLKEAEKNRQIQAVAEEYGLDIDDTKDQKLIEKAITNKMNLNDINELAQRKAEMLNGTEYDTDDDDDDSPTDFFKGVSKKKFKKPIGQTNAPHGAVDYTDKIKRDEYNAQLRKLGLRPGPR